MDIYIIIFIEPRRIYILCVYIYMNYIIDYYSHYNHYYIQYIYIYILEYRQFEPPNEQIHSIKSPGS